MTSLSDQRLRIAAIDFLNPAPLMWDFEHAPHAATLATRYDIQRMLPSECAASLIAGTSDLGLIPIAALTPDLAIVPGCTIASLDRVRSIQLIVRGDRPITDVQTVAADTASRSSLAYANILFRKFLGISPAFVPHRADPIAMLQSADAALLIGDPALLALEARAFIEEQVGPCQWFDIAHEWTTRTGLPWVAAVWAVRPEAVTSPAQLLDDLNESRVNGMAHVEDLVAEWTPRLAIPPATIRDYLHHNIHYTLDQRCVEAITLFRTYAAEIHLLPALPDLRFI
jgi:chorismate dehydratase